MGGGWFRCYKAQSAELRLNYKPFKFAMNLVNLRTTDVRLFSAHLARLTTTSITSVIYVPLGPGVLDIRLRGLPI